MSFFPPNSAAMNNAIDAQFSLFLSGGNPIINFDPNDFIQFIRSTNQLNFGLSGFVPVTIEPVRVFFGSIPILPPFTVATLPSAAFNARGIIYVSDGTANKRQAISDGTNWRWPDGTIVS